MMPNGSRHVPWARAMPSLNSAADSSSQCTESLGAAGDCAHNIEALSTLRDSSNDLDTYPPGNVEAIGEYDERAGKSGGMMRGALFALALLSAGCGHAGRSGSPEPQAKTTVKIENHNFLDMNVYVLQGGQRIRLGTVNGLSTAVFTLPDFIARSTSVQFELHPIGGATKPPPENHSPPPCGGNSAQGPAHSRRKRNG